MIEPSLFTRGELRTPRQLVTVADDKSVMVFIANWGDQYYEINYGALVGQAEEFLQKFVMLGLVINLLMMNEKK